LNLIPLINRTITKNFLNKFAWCLVYLAALISGTDIAVKNIGFILLAILFVWAVIIHLKGKRREE